MFSLSLQFIILSGLLFLAVMPVAANSQESQVQRLPRIDVLSDDAVEILKTPGAAQRVSPEQIKMLQPLSAQDAIKKVSGIHVVETDGFGLFPRISFRGLNPDMSRKVLLLEDGAPIALGPFIDPSAYYMPPIERMETIEVLKGASTLRYGPSTIGGTINFITKTHSATPAATVSLRGGTQGFQSAQLFAGGTWNQTNASLALSQTSGLGNRENSRFTITDVVAKTGFSLNESHFLSAKVTYFDNSSQATYRGLTQEEFLANPYQNPAADDFIKVARTSFDLNHEWLIRPNSKLKTLFYSNNADRDWWRQNLNATTLALNAGNRGRLREFTVAGIDSRYSWDTQSESFGNKLEIGVRLHTEEMQNQEIDGLLSDSRSGSLRTDDYRKAKSQALFAQNTFVLTENLEITTGARLESYSQSRNVLRTANSNVTDFGNRSNSEFMPALSALWKISEQSAFFTGAHAGFAPPRVEDSIAVDGTVSQLEAERSTNLELGFRHLGELNRFEVTAFHLDFSNQIVVASQSGGSGLLNTNAGKTLHQGIEASAQQKLVGPLSADITLTYVPVAKLNSTRILSGLDRNGNRLTYAPEQVASLGLNYKAEKWFVRGEYNSVSAQFSDLENTEPGSANGRTGLIPAYSILNFAGEYRLSKDTAITASLKNALDQVYIASRAPQGIFVGLQRTAFIGVRSSF